MKKRTPPDDLHSSVSVKETPGASKKASTGLTAELWTYPLTSIAVTSLGLLLALLLIGWQVIVSGNSEQRKAIEAAHLSSLTSFFDAKSASLKNQIGAIAQSPSVVNAMITFDRQMLRKEADRIKNQFKYAERVELFERGKAEVELNASIPITFAAMDVIKRAESQPYVGPEAFKLGQNVIIYVAQPITHDGKVSGVLFMAISMNYFIDPLQSFDPDHGNVILQQRFEGAPTAAILQYGANVGSEIPLYAELQTGNWRLAYSPDRQTREPILSWTMLIVPFAAAFSLVLGTASLGFGRLFRALEEDGTKFMDDTSRLLRGRAPGVNAYNLSMFETLANNTGKFARSRGPLDNATQQSSSKHTDEYNDAKRDEHSDSEDFLEVRSTPADENNFGIEVSEDTSPIGMGLDLDPEIFRAYDIRGIVTSNLTSEIVYWIGRAFAGQAREANQERVAVGRDGRLSSPELSEALIRGLTEGGLDVLDIGMVPTPLLYYATHALNTGTGIMITGSHNPPDYNGLKMVLAGTTLAEDSIQTLRARIESNNLPEGEGSSETVDIIASYLDRVTEDVVLAQAPKIVIDCGNGVAGNVAPQLLRDLGCEVIELYCEVDGNFPNHHPDPAEQENLADLITVVEAENADLGLAFDGDGDRLGVITNKGTIIWPDKLLMLFSRDIVGRNPGSDIIYDVKCSRHLNTLISEYGGRPIMCKTGHSNIKAKIKETGALLGGEFSGHICFAERWYGFDDALYSAARLLEITASETKTVEELFDEFPITFMTPELKIQTTESRKTEVMQLLNSKGDFGGGTMTNIDGIRVDYPDGWGLIRQSNTSPVLTLRFEADGQAPLDRIQKIFQSQLHKLDPALTFLK